MLTAFDNLLLQGIISEERAIWKGNRKRIATSQLLIRPVYTGFSLFTPILFFFFALTKE